MRFGSLFSGIGGLDLGLERAGHECAWQVELDPYCQAVLRKHWPHVPKYADVRTVGDELERVEFICGGFPCQPVSLAGRRRGAADERWLWPEFTRILRLLRPRYALLENVPGLLAGGGMAEVLGDLAALGFDAEWDCIPAAAVGAPHLRYRVFIVAYTQGVGGELRSPESERLGRPAGGCDAVADAERNGLEGLVGSRPAPGPARGASALADAAAPRPQDWPALAERSAAFACEPERSDWWAVEPDVGRVAHGVPSRVDRLRALGNAVVPQVAEAIGQLLLTPPTSQE